MPKYYVNTKPQPITGDHEVHKEGCFYLPLVISKIDLGYHDNCSTAVAAAKKHYLSADGCIYCSPTCHKS